MKSLSNVRLTANRNLEQANSVLSLYFGLALIKIKISLSDQSNAFILVLICIDKKAFQSTKEIAPKCSFKYNLIHFQLETLLKADLTMGDFLGVVQNIQNSFLVEHLRSVFRTLSNAKAKSC